MRRLCHGRPRRRGSDRSRTPHLDVYHAHLGANHAHLDANHAHPDVYHAHLGAIHAHLDAIHAHLGLESPQSSDLHRCARGGLGSTRFRFAPADP